MISGQVNKSKNDEYYTPAYAIHPIKKYLKPNSVIWCPFDTLESYFVNELDNAGHAVINTHIDNGEDFFELDIDCDYIISNPPYSKKVEVFKRLFELGKPFAMLVGVVGLFDSKEKMELFKGKKIEIMYLSPRVSYFQDYKEEKPSKNPAFQSVYLCSGILPEQIVFEQIYKDR